VGVRDQAPFTADDLAELDDQFLSRASNVIAMCEIHAGNNDPNAIGMRHDVDASSVSTSHAFATAVQMAEWEAEHGYRSTYYVLHTAPYWVAPGFREGLDRIVELGHEIGIHTNALAEALRTGGDPHLILESAILRLRSWGHSITGVAGHGDSFCNRDCPNEPAFANDEQFVECARPTEGEPDRTITRGQVAYKLDPRPLADFGLEYEALRVSGEWPHWRISDSGGRWKHADYEPTFDEAAEVFEVRLTGGRAPSQLQLLVHPDWWEQAFTRRPVEVAA
jgi:peptidoglycan/xylan/chitin deacetylase (PgdA/CDA1 family)